MAGAATTASPLTATAAQAAESGLLVAQAAPLVAWVKDTATTLAAAMGAPGGISIVLSRFIAPPKEGKMPEATARPASRL
jgi:hypothetical protein